MKLPFGLDLAEGARLRRRAVSSIARRREAARDPALEELPRGLHPARRRTLHGDGAGLGISRAGQRRPHAGHGGDQLAHDARALRRARWVPARRRTAAGSVAGPAALHRRVRGACRSSRGSCHDDGSSRRRARPGSTSASCTCSRRSRSARCSCTLVLLFSFKGDVILENPLTIVWIAVPLTLQTLLIFGARLRPVARCSGFATPTQRRRP